MVQKPRLVCHLLLEMKICSNIPILFQSSMAPVTLPMADMDSWDRNLMARKSKIFTENVLTWNRHKSHVF